MSEAQDVAPQYDRKTLSDQSFIRDKIDDFSAASTASESYDNSRLISVETPEANSSSFLTKLFYRTEDMPINFLGVHFNFDVFLGNFDTSELSSTRQVRKSKFSITILEQLQRFQTSANIDRKSLEAFAVMLNVANNGGRIVAVIAHGGPYKNPSTDRDELRISTKQGKANIDELISELAIQKDSDGNQRYQLIYFNACNETGIPINAKENDNPVSIPVITYTDINKGIQGLPGKLKVYWPSSSTGLTVKSKIASILKR